MTINTSELEELQRLCEKPLKVEKNHHYTYLEVKILVDIFNNELREIRSEIRSESEKNPSQYGEMFQEEMIYQIVRGKIKNPPDDTKRSYDPKLKSIVERIIKIKKQRDDLSESFYDGKPIVIEMSDDSVLKLFECI